MGRNAQFMLDVMRETGINWWPVPVITRTRFSRNMWRPARAGTGAGDGR